MHAAWPDRLPAVQLRIARPTGDLQRAVAFYRDGLGLPMVYSYQDDADYDGVMFGLPGREYNLEITQHRGDGPCPPPSPDNVLVFYVLNQDAIQATLMRLNAMGYAPTQPRNPYWAAHGVTIPDPDGWHVILAHSHGFGSEFGP